MAALLGQGELIVPILAPRREVGKTQPLLIPPRTLRLTLAPPRVKLPFTPVLPPSSHPTRPEAAMITRHCFSLFAVLLFAFVAFVPAAAEKPKNLTATLKGHKE